MTLFLEKEALQTARNINGVFPSNVITKQTVINWLTNFRPSNFDLTNEPPSRAETNTNGKPSSQIYLMRP